MKTEHSISALPLAMGLLWLSYAFLGWYLAAHHVIWLVGVLIVLLSVAIAWKGKPLLEYFQLGVPELFVILTIILVSIGFVYLLITPSVLPSLVLPPLLASLLADLELRTTDCNRQHQLLLLMLLTSLGLGLGEIVDLLLLPSVRL